VLLPGSYFDEGKGQREDLFFSRNKGVNHIDLLHRVTEGVMVDLLERHVGLDWEQRLDALEALREQQRQITTEAPHGVDVQLDGEEIPFWVGLRSTDESTCAVGYYRGYPLEEDGADTTERALEFRPLMTDFSLAEGLEMAAICVDYLKKAHTLVALCELAEAVNHPQGPEPMAPVRESTGPVRSGPSLDL